MFPTRRGYHTFEVLLSKFFSSEGKNGASTFNEKAFLKSVQDGRRDLLIGWAAFLLNYSIPFLNIIFPTNPGAKFLWSLCDWFKDQIVDK